MIETLFIIFPPGLGGNHLANMLSLTDRFNRPVDFSLYDSPAKDAHFNNIRNLQETSLEEHPEIFNQSSVLTGHLAEYLWLQNSGFAERFQNRKFLAIQFPEKNSLAYKRMVALYPYFDNIYYYYEFEALYSQKILERIFDEHDFFQIASETIFSENAGPLLDYIEQEFYTTLDREFAADRHAKWIDKIKASIN